MRFAFKTAPQHTSWDDMLAVWKEADGIEIFESGWLFDHFYPIVGDSNGPCLEGWAALAALAQATTRLRLGTLVTGIHYRHPAVLANMAATIDIISGGRLELGIGAGWNEQESGAYGIELGTPRERSDRFEEACQVLISLLSQETHDVRGPVLPAQGRLERAQGAAAAASADLHRRQRRAADAADHRQVRPALELHRRQPEEFAHKRDVLHAHCQAVGRDPAEILLSSHVVLTHRRSRGARRPDRGARRGGARPRDRLPAAAALPGRARSAGRGTRRDPLTPNCVIEQQALRSLPPVPARAKTSDQVICQVDAVFAPHLAHPRASSAEAARAWR